MIHVPGSLYSVNPTTARAITALFARNERLVCIFDTAHGPLAMVLVGATIVGSIATVWHGAVTPPRPTRPRQWQYDASPITLEKGAEMGRFLLGSTVVLLWPSGSMSFNERWAESALVRMGETMANVGVA
jgi:phosphatidylserine decarboxylase